MKCGSVHIWSDCRCIREAGHEGRCWGRAVSFDRAFSRAEWLSENGKFKTHVQYATVYPRNAMRPVRKEPK